eukprot:COSAG06_NODE_431_length_15859_cov_19.762500_8_plen_151_part_00
MWKRRFAVPFYTQKPEHLPRQARDNPTAGKLEKKPRVSHPQVIVPLLITIFVGIAKGLVPICPREVICSRSLKTCVVAELAVDSECGGGAATAVAAGSSGDGEGGVGGGSLQLEAQFGKGDGRFGLENASFEPLYIYKDDHFTKTGSGLT